MTLPPGRTVRLIAAAPAARGPSRLPAWLRAAGGSGEASAHGSFQTLRRGRAPAALTSVPEGRGVTPGIAVAVGPWNMPFGRADRRPRGRCFPRRKPGSRGGVAPAELQPVRASYSHRTPCSAGPGEAADNLPRPRQRKQVRRGPAPQVAPAPPTHLRAQPRPSAVWRGQRPSACQHVFILCYFGRLP